MKRLFRGSSRISLTAACLLAACILLAPAPVQAQTASAKPEATASSQPMTIAITLDATDAPELEPMLQKMKTECEKMFPVIVKALDADTTQLRHVALFKIDKNYKGVAATMGTRIVFAPDYYRTHQDDLGSAVHEMTHIIQGYRSTRRNPNPGWLVEGLDDYIRFWIYEPVNKRPKPRNLNRASYTNSYQVTAAFLGWIVEKKQATKLIPVLNTAMRQAQYRPEIWKEQTGKDLDGLWAEYKADNPQALGPAATPRPASATAAPAAAAAKPLAIAITLDAKEVPEMEPMLQKMKADCEKMYPVFVKALNADTPALSHKASFTIHKEGRGVAGTSGDVVVFDAPYYRTHPNDIGSAVHEMVHVIQGYPSNGGNPGWLVEGVADYLRWWVYEAVDKRPAANRINPARHKYTDSYQVTGGFLAWIVEKKQATKLIATLNTAMREAKYRPEIFKEQTGKDLDGLWEEYKTDMAPKVQPAAAAAGAAGTAVKAAGN